jgi:hypothetical protein
MAKVKINSLPPGLTIKNGKIVSMMQQGGMTTGDQFDFGLVTNVKDPNKENESRDLNVRHTLNAVPREEANIEAEGGETVLTDLDNDGLFGLYEIKGPRHSSGGVPLNLPEQSFVFSDTKEMKLGGSDLEAFGIKSRKKMTPADISKKYDLNTYYGAIKDQYADDIQVKSAELMMDKNKKALSKLAFVQESKKDFEEGVPVTAHPYLLSQGIDPIDFTAKVERISMEKAQQKAIAALPPEQQQQLMMIQQMMQQAEASQQQMAQEPSPEEMVMEMGKYGKELPKAQFGPELNFNNPLNFGTEYVPPFGFSQYAPTQTNTIPLNNHWDLSVRLNNLKGPFGFTQANFQPVTTNTAPATRQTSQASTSGTSGEKKNTAIDPDIVKKYETDLNIIMDVSDVGEQRYVDRQPSEKLPGRYGDASLNEQGWLEEWAPLYPDAENLLTSLETYQPANGEEYKNPEVLKFQQWFNNEYILSAVNDINAKLKEAGYNELTEQQKLDLTTHLRNDFGFGTGTGKDFDGRWGTFSSSRRPVGYNIKPKPSEEVPKEGCPCEDGKTYSQDCCPKDKPLEVPELPKSAKRPNAEWWLQDLLGLNAVAARERDMFFPFQPAVANVDLGYVLEEPTRAIAAINEQLGLQTQAAGAFGGPQALAARTAQAQGQAARAIADEVGRVNQRNVSTINEGLAMQAQMDAILQRERRDRVVKEYDDTQDVLQGYMDEKNFDREQYAQLMAGAVTNRANTYNVNSIQDYYQIDPGSGGMIGQFSGKAFEPAPLPDPMANIKQYAEAAKLLKAAGINPTAELIQGMMAQPALTAQETNIQRAYRSMPQGYGYTDPAAFQQGRSKKGKEVKETIVPFYVGQIGG